MCPDEDESEVDCPRDTAAVTSTADLMIRKQRTVTASGHATFATRKRRYAASRHS